jgi:hypothetical protein
MIAKHGEHRLASAKQKEVTTMQAPSIDTLTTRFCRALGEDTGRHPIPSLPSTWRVTLGSQQVTVTAVYRSISSHGVLAFKDGGQLIKAQRQ